MMSARNITLAFVAAVLMVPAMASAEPPSKLPIQAYLTDGEGVPLDTETTIQVELYDAESGGNSLHSEQLTVEPSAGSFTAYLGSQETLDLSIFRNNSEVWAAITVNGETLEPRLQVATAPYAASASYAETAGDASTLEGQSAGDFEYSAGEGLTKEGQAFKVDKSVIQSRVDGSCGSNEFAVGINQDGSLMCESVADRLADGSITSAKVQDGAISASDLSTGAVSTGKLQNSAVTGQKINNGSVGNSKIASGSVGSGKLQSKAVTSGTINGGAIGQSKLASGSVSTGKLQSNAVKSGKINDGAVSQSKLASGSVSSGKLQNSAVTTDKLNDGSVTSAKLKSNAVTNGKIDDEAVNAGNIAQDSVGLYQLNRRCENTYMEPSGCPVDPTADATNLPSCQLAPQGSFCFSTGACNNAPDNVGNCTDRSGSPVSVYIKGTTRIIP